MLINKLIKGITLLTSSDCNLNCMYCFTKTRRENANVISIHIWERVMSEAKNMGAEWVILAGPGEPLLSTDTFKLIEYASYLKMKTMLFTNGTLITKDIADFLIANKVNLTFKIHSFDPGMHDFLAGIENSAAWVDYEYRYKNRTIRHPIPFSLSILLDKIPIFYRKELLRIETVITKYNLEHLISLAVFIKAHRLDYLFETILSPVDRSLDNLVPNNTEYSNVFKALKNHLGLGFRLGQMHSGCTIRNNPVIWEDGSIAKCLFEYSSVGNIRDDTLHNLWLKRMALKDRKVQKKHLNGFRHCLGRQSAQVQ